MLSAHILDDICNWLCASYDTSPYKVLISLLGRKNELRTVTSAELVIELSMHAPEIAAALLEHEPEHKNTEGRLALWARRITVSRCGTGIWALVDEESSRFNAAGMHAQQIEFWKIWDIADQMQACAPVAWSVLTDLLNIRNTWGSADRNDDVHMAFPTSSFESYWDELDEPSLSEDPFDPKSNADQFKHEQRKTAILTMKTVLCMSIILQNTNRSCNALQSLIGIFLHSTNTPTLAINLFSQMGVSISSVAIVNAVSSLSKESRREIKHIGQTKLVSLAYDNFNFQLKSGTPLVEQSDDSMVHMTSGMYIPLFNTKLEDLRCSEELWRKGWLRDPTPAGAPHIVMGELFKRLVDRPSATEMSSPSTSDHSDSISDLFDDEDGSSNDEQHAELTRFESFNAWKFCETLVRWGPSYLEQFGTHLGDPEPIEMIPLHQSTQRPLRATEDHQSKIQGNIDALTNFMQQGGFEACNEREDEVPSTENEDCNDVAACNHTARDPLDGHVVLVHGDLGTYERICGLQLSRSQEHDPYRRFQWVIFVPGLFHVKMACVDALWRIFIEPQDRRGGANSLMRYVEKICPKQTGTFTTKTSPQFHIMHDFIQHVGIASRLDCWRVEAESKNGQWRSLDEWAKSEPSWHDILMMLDMLACKHVTNETLGAIRNRPSEKRDLEHENTLLREQYMLLYEHITYAMNARDIGRVEMCLVPWLGLFKKSGKHKYARLIARFLHDLHSEYPPRLRYIC